MGRLVVAPPGVDHRIYQAWKSAFEATVRDPEFKKAAGAAGLDVGLGSADDFRKNNQAFEKLSPKMKKLVRKLGGLK